MLSENKGVREDEDAVRFYMKVLMEAWNEGFTLVCCKSCRKERSKEGNEVVIELRRDFSS